MAAKQFPLSVVIRAVDLVTAPMRGIQGAIKRFDSRIGATARGVSDRLGLPAMTEATKRFGSAMGALSGQAMRVLGVLTAIGGAVVGLGYLAVKSLIGTASQFEKYETILTTIEGSQQKAAKAMAWVSDFAAKTPYELNEVMESFVKLRAYGIDPTNGTLRVLGDTAAAMGKPVMQAVEAIADAMTGENERLKEFGIRAKKEGDKITYEYTKDGKTMTKSAKLSNRAMVQATLMAIWNDRYAGAMDKLSGTWGGMTSNLSDQWERFKLMIMKSGPFEILRKRLAALLERIDAMAASGELQRLAEAIGTWLVDKFDKLWAAGERLVSKWDDIKAMARPFTMAISWMVEKFGGMNVIIGAVSAIIVVTMVPAIYAAATAFYALGVAVMTTPIGWIAALILALVAALVVLYMKSEAVRKVVNFFAATFLTSAVFTIKLIDAIFDLVAALADLGSAAIEAGVKFATDLVDKIKEGVNNGLNALKTFRDSMVKMIPDWVKNLFGGKGSANVNVSGAASLGAAAAGGKAAAAQQSSVRVQVDMNNLPPGTRVSSEQNGRPDFELNQGYAMGAG